MAMILWNLCWMKDRPISENGKQVIIRKFKRSGNSVSRFCLDESISQSVLRSLLKGSGFDETGAGRFVPLRLVEVDGQWFALIIG